MAYIFYLARLCVWYWLLICITFTDILYDLWGLLNLPGLGWETIFCVGIISISETDSLLQLEDLFFLTNKEV